MTENEWTNGTTIIPNFEINVAFLTHKEYFFGNENDHRQIVDKTNFTEPLYIPFADKNFLVTTNNVYENIDELIRYYQDVLTLAKKHGKKPSQYYFWVRPIIRDLETKQILAGFPWYDTLIEIRRLFSELKKETEGNIFFDADQSWQLIIDNFNGHIFIKEFDPDDNEIYCQIKFNRQEMIEQIEEVLQKTENIITKLTNHFGTDYWTTRI